MGHDGGEGSGGEVMASRLEARRGSRAARR